MDVVGIERNGALQLLLRSHLLHPFQRHICGTARMTKSCASMLCGGFL